MGRPSLDLLDEKCGRWTVLERVRSEGTSRTYTYWRCRCDCGTERVLASTRLARGRTRSCGCLGKDGNRQRAPDITGQRFGRLVVVSRAPDAGRRGARWICRCDCGKHHTVSGTGLRKTDGTRSCGCLATQSAKRLLTKHGGDVGRNVLVSLYRSSAVDRGYAFELTHDECERLFLSPCHWCGAPPAHVLKAGTRRQHTFIHNGIDRLVNESGYTVANSVACCKVCNRAKGTMAPQDFMAWVHRLVEFHSHTQLAPSTLSARS